MSCVIRLFLSIADYVSRLLFCKSTIYLGVIKQKEQKYAQNRCSNIVRALIQRLGRAMTVLKSNLNDFPIIIWFTKK